MTTLSARRFKQNDLDPREGVLTLFMPHSIETKVRSRSPEFSRKTHPRALRESVKRQGEGNSGDRHPESPSRHTFSFLHRKAGNSGPDYAGAEADLSDSWNNKDPAPLHPSAFINHDD